MKITLKELRSLIRTEVRKTLLENNSSNLLQEVDIETQEVDIETLKNLLKRELELEFNKNSDFINNFVDSLEGRLVYDSDEDDELQVVYGTVKVQPDETIATFSIPKDPDLVPEMDIDKENLKNLMDEYEIFYEIFQVYIKKINEYNKTAKYPKTVPNVNELQIVGNSIKNKKTGAKLATIKTAEEDPTTGVIDI